jgi:hypothetical protein
MSGADGAALMRCNKSILAVNASLGKLFFPLPPIGALQAQQGFIPIYNNIDAAQYALSD